MSASAHPSNGRRFILPVVREMSVEDHAMQAKRVRESLLTNDGPVEGVDPFHSYANAHLGAC